MEAIYITNIKGKKIEVADLEEAIRQAKNAVDFHEEKMKLHKTNPEEIICPEAYEEWKYNLVELEKLKNKGVKVVGEPKKEGAFNNKYYNTLKMMGVPTREVFEFTDAFLNIRTTISKDLQQEFRQTILNTKIMDKTVKKWFEHYIKKGEKLGIKTYNDKNIEVPITIKDFDIDNKIEYHNVMGLLDIILQEYYKSVNLIEI